jgi:hypothetical protein
MTTLDVPQPAFTLEVRPGVDAIVMRGFGQLDEQLAEALVAQVATFPRSVPIVLDLSELTLARAPGLPALLRELAEPTDALVRRVIVVCRRITARRLVRQAARFVPLAVAATVDEALLGCGRRSTRALPQRRRGPSGRGA